MTPSFFKFSGIGEDDLLRVADRFGIGTAPDILARVRDATNKQKRIK